MARRQRISYSRHAQSITQKSFLTRLMFFVLCSSAHTNNKLFLSSGTSHHSYTINFYHFSHTLFCYFYFYLCFVAQPHPLASNNCLRLNFLRLHSADNLFFCASESSSQMKVCTLNQ